jgi:hypothetical protein
MHRNQLLAATLAALTVSGCASIPQPLQLSATPLTDKPSGSTEYEKAHSLVQDSQTRCAIFLNSLFGSVAGDNYALGLLGTTTSALATAFKPVATAHALTAATSIFTGAKAGISTEYLNALSVSHVTQAIQSLYWADMSKYVTSLNATYASDPTKINAAAERSTILGIHNECSLAAAEGSITSSLTPGSNGQSTAATATPPTLAYKVDATKFDVQTIAVDLAGKINANADFIKAGVTAAPTSGTQPADKPAHVDLTMKTPVKIAVDVAAAKADGTPQEKVAFVAGPPAQITITPTTAPKLGDGDTISLTLPAPEKPAAAAPAAPAPEAQAPPPHAAALLEARPAIPLIGRAVPR